MIRHGDLIDRDEYLRNIRATMDALDDVLSIEFRTGMETAIQILESQPVVTETEWRSDV